MIAAWSAATSGAHVILLEKTSRLGTKILISGGGKCNITHDGPIEDVLKEFRPNEARFIRPACYRFLNTRIVEMLTDRGLLVYTRDDGRIFPVDQTAKDVVAILEEYVREAGVEIRLDSPVRTILTRDDAVSGVKLADGIIDTDRVILASGGSSYPKTGTTGDGWPWAKELGHTIVPIIAALAPIDMARDGMDPRAGIALRDVILRARIDGKEVTRWRGDLLFTHRGVSGPTVLGISRIVAEHEPTPCSLEVDLAPDQKLDALQGRIVAEKQADPRRRVANLIEGMAPKNLLPDISLAAGLNLDTPLQSVSNKDLNRLAIVLKGWDLGLVRTVPLEKGEVVAGGVSLDEVDPRTMASRVCPGLFLCGEVLDIAGPVGGYNLQAAFATGFVAGESAANLHA